MSSMVDDLLARLSPTQLADQLGTDPDTAMSAARHAMSALLGGLAANAQTEDGRRALASTLGKKHDGSLLDKPNLLGEIDTADGQKIVAHTLGGRDDGVLQALGSVSGADSAVFSKLLPLLAPLVLAWLSKRTGISGSTARPRTTPGGLGGGIGDILAQILGQQSLDARSKMPDVASIFDVFRGDR